MLVQICTRTINPASGVCVGPPTTFPLGHEVQGADPAMHIEICTTCFATMIQCWRGECEPAQNAVAKYLDKVVDRQVGSLAKNLPPSIREEARQDVLVAISRKVQTNPSWSQDRVASLVNHASWVTEAVRRLYFTWYRRNFKGHLAEENTADNNIYAEILTFDGVITDAPSSTGLESYGSHPRDPADVIFDDDRLRNVLISPDASDHVEASLGVLRQLLKDKADDRIVFFAGWMKYAAETRGRGSIRAYCRLQEVDETTGWRHIRQVQKHLATLVTDQVGVDEETRETTLNFLHRIAMHAMPMPMPMPLSSDNQEGPEL